MRCYALLILFYPFSLLSQNTYSERLSVDINTIGFGVWEMEDGYMQTGVTLDTSASVLYSKLWIRKTNMSGQEQWIKTYGTAEQSFFNFLDAFIRLNDGNFVVANQTMRGDSMLGQLTWFDANGDTIRTLLIRSPTFLSINQNNWFVPTYLSNDDQDNIYLSAQVTQVASGNDFSISKFTSLGELVWDYIYTQSPQYDICFSINAEEEGVIVVAANDNLVTSGNYYTEYFFKLDTEGNLKWEYIERPEFNLFQPQEIVLSNDKVIVATAYYDGFEGGDAFIYAMDTLNHVCWSGHVENIGYRSGFTNIDKTCDAGYVCSGNFREVLPAYDSINGIANEGVLLVKFDSIGNLLWQRKYHYLEAPSDYHRIYDMKATSDGGYIMVGEATDQTGANANWQPVLPRQQGWILKVDACGCLVPGCDSERMAMSCGCEVPFFPEVPHYFLTGPNPATHSLNIYYGDVQDVSTAAEFRVHDMNGKLVYAFKPTTTSTTYIVDVSEWARGQYVLSLIDGSRVMQSEKVIVVRE